MEEEKYWSRLAIHVEQFKDDDLFRFLVIIFLHILQNGLEKLSEHDFDSGIWRNILSALTYLKKMNNNREKIE